MVNQLLKNGMLFFPQNLKINKKIKIGLVGSGSIAHEYCKIIKYFHHEIYLLITKTNSKKTDQLKKKYNIKNHILNFNHIKDYEKYIDAFVVATPWNQNHLILLKLINFKKPILIEKPIIFTDYSHKKLKTLNKNYKEKIHISYNRNFYDFVPLIIKHLKINKEALIIANLSDSFEKIISKRGKKIKKYLLEYITSHWLCFLYMLAKNVNMKLELINKNNNQKNLRSFTLNLKNGRKRSKKQIILNLIPDVPKNLSIEFFFQKKYIKLSPIEEINIINDLKLKRKANQNIYIEVLEKNYKVNNSFKPGYKLMYYEFVKNVFFSKKSNFSINLFDLFHIQDLIKYLK